LIKINSFRIGKYLDLKEVMNNRRGPLRIEKEVKIL